LRDSNTYYNDATANDYSVKIRDLAETQTPTGKIKTLQAQIKALKTQQSLSNWISSTLTILGKRGSLFKEAINEFVEQIFTAAPQKVNAQVEQKIQQEIAATMPAPDASPSVITAWINSISNVISNAIFTAKPTSQTLTDVVQSQDY